MVEKWKLKIAPNKSQIIYIGKNNQKKGYQIGGVVIPEEECIRDLGVLVDKKLTFKQHINKIVKSGYFKAYQLLRVLHTQSPKLWSIAYNPTVTEGDFRE